MFTAWRIASARATLRQAPRQSILGIASWIAVFASPAILIGLIVTIGFRSAAPGLVVAAWVLLVVAVLVGAVGYWVWRVGELVRTQVREHYPELPAIESERLVVRQAKPQDAAALDATIDDVMLDANGWTEQNRCSLIVAIRRGYPTAAAQYVVVSKADGGVIGEVSIHPGTDPETSRRIGWSMGPLHRGAGYATEAVLAVATAIHDAGYPIVEIGTNETNFAIQRICDKIGAVEVDRRSTTLPNGMTVPGIWYEHRRGTGNQHAAHLSKSDQPNT